MKNLKSIFLAILIGFFALIPGIADSVGVDEDGLIWSFTAEPEEVPLGGLVTFGWEAFTRASCLFGFDNFPGEHVEPLEDEHIVKMKQKWGVGEFKFRLLCSVLDPLLPSLIDSRTITITVVKPAPTEISISPSGAEININETQRFSAIVLPEHADQRVTWSVDPVAIGTIDDRGVFRALSEGTVTVTATSVVDPNIRETADVTVKRPPPTSITISPNRAEININKSQQFSVIIYPEYADQSVTWSVGDPAIGTIDANGLFRANAAGTVTVIATSKAPPYITGIVTVTVKERDPDQNQVQPPVQDPDQDRVRPPAQEEEERRGVCEGPLVPCGPDRAPCELCHIFILFNNIIQFVLICLVPPVAVAMLVIGGFVLMFAGGAPQLKSKAMSILKSAVIGLFIIYGAWLFINTFLAIIGVMDWTGLHEWFQPAIDCPVGPLPEAPAAFGQQGAEG